MSSIWIRILVTLAARAGVRRRRNARADVWHFIILKCNCKKRAALCTCNVYVCGFFLRLYPSLRGLLSFVNHQSRSGKFKEKTRLHSQIKKSVTKANILVSLFFLPCIHVFCQTSWCVSCFRILICCMFEIHSYS